MELIPIAYCCVIPLLLIVLFLPFRFSFKKYILNLLATANVLMIPYAVFLVRQLLGIVQLAKKMAGSFHLEKQPVYGSVNGFFIRDLLIILLAVCFLFKKLRSNLVFTLCLLVLVCWNHPVGFWNTYNLLFKIPAYLCLFCAAYALLWLWNKLPYQSFVK
jgi:hypothetical protein